VIPTIEEDTIHLLRASLDPPPVAMGVLERVISREERARAERFRFGALRRRHVVSRGLLRMVLGEVLDQPPEGVKLVREAHGKPAMASGGLGFNLSHSGDDLLIGLVGEGRLGVDLERVRSFSDLEALARRTFAEEEIAELLALPPDMRARAFFRGWTRKEAFIKAVGGGLSIPLTSFAVRLSRGEGDALVRLDSSCAGQTSGWWISSVDHDGDPELEMAVAWDRSPARIHQVNLTGEHFVP